MAKRIGLNVLSLLLIVSVLFGLAMPVQPVQAGTETYNHIIPFTITDTSGVDRTNIPVIISFDVDGNLVVYGLTNATCTDTYVDSSGTSNSPVGSGTAYEYMMTTENITAFIPSLPAYGSVTLNLYTGYAPVQTSFPLITGVDGYVTVADNETIELGDNFTVVQDGWWDTDAGAEKNAVWKRDAFRTYVSPTVSGNITSEITSADWQNIFPEGIYTNNEWKEHAYAEREVSGTRLKLKNGSAGDNKIHEVEVWDGSAWVTPISAVGATWTDIEKAFDGDNGTFAYDNAGGGVFTGYLTFQLSSPVSSTKMRAWCSHSVPNVTKCEIDVNVPDILASVSATGVESGEHEVTTIADTTFFYLEVDDVTWDDYAPQKADLEFNAPLWHTELDGSPFTSEDATEYPCTVTGATWSSDGYVFDGDDYITVGSSANNTLYPTSFTWEFWVNPTNTDAHRGLLGGTSGNARPWDSNISTSDQSSFRLKQIDDTEISLTLGDLTVTTGAFNHIVFTGDGSTVRGYLDGVESAATASYDGTLKIVSREAIRIGVARNTWWMIGTFGEVRLYDRALTPAEVLSNYNATKWKYDGSSEHFYYQTVGAGVPDTDADWTFYQNNVMPYADSTTIEVDGVQELWFEPNALISSSTLPDRQGDNDGTITWGTNTDITITGGNIMDSRSATSVGVTSAMMQGNLFDIGTYASVYLAFQYGLDTNYGYTTSETSAATEQTLSVTLTGLTPNTTYHYRAVARNGVVYSYGEDTTFTTAYSTASQGSTTPLIISAGVFSDYIDTGDWLFCAEVVVTYPPYYPTGIPPEYFQIQLLDTDGTTILGASPLRQWGDRPASIYLAPTANVTNMSSYVIRITNVSSENITVNTTHTLESGEWYGDNLDNLDDWCRGAAWSMQSTDGTLLTDPYLRSVTDYGLIITDAASGYFTTGIPSIAQVRPNLFSTAEHKLALTTLSGDVDYNVGSTLTDRVGATIVADATTVGGVLNLSGQQLLFYVILATILGCIVYTVSNTQGFGALGALCLSVPIVGASVYFNIMEIVLPIIVIIIFVFLFVRQFIWKTM